MLRYTTENNGDVDTNLSPAFEFPYVCEPEWKRVIPDSLSIQN